MQMHHSGFVILAMGYISWLGIGVGGVQIWGMLGLLPLLGYTIQEFPDRDKRRHVPPLATASRVVQIIGLSCMIAGFGFVFLEWSTAPLFLLAGSVMTAIAAILFMGDGSPLEFSRMASLIATFLCCVSFAANMLAMPYSRMAFMATFPLFFVLQVVHFFVKRQQKKKPKLPQI